MSLPLDPNNVLNMADPELPNNHFWNVLFHESRNSLIFCAVWALIAPTVCNPLTTTLPTDLMALEAAFTPVLVHFFHSQLTPFPIVDHEANLNAVILLHVQDNNPPIVVPDAVAIACVVAIVPNVTRRIGVIPVVWDTVPIIGKVQRILLSIAGPINGAACCMTGKIKSK